MAPGSVKVIEGEGMPVYVDDSKLIRDEFDLLKPVSSKRRQGDLYILFDVEFPKTLSREQRMEIASILL
jgi:DnaJ-class molecular chaperone